MVMKQKGMDRFVEIPGESWPWWRSLIELAALGSKPAEECSLNRIHPTAGSVEGFLAARWLTAALEKAGPQPTRQRIVAAFESLSELDLGGFRLKLGPKDHQASDFVDLTFLGVQRWGS
jgi:hypothetical protein